MLRLIEHDGLSPSRAASISAVPTPTLEQAQSLVTAAESRYQLTAVRSIRDAGRDTLKLEYQWQPVDPNTVNLVGVLQANGDGPVAAAGLLAPASPRARAFPRSGDWKATAFLLERRFPSEYGNQQPAQVAETVVNVLSALAALRQQPASLGSLRHVPQLPAPQVTEDARAREGDGTRGDRGTT